jgi:nitrite reductase/ring-hydroxylating ferredoxin subunit
LSEHFVKATSTSAIAAGGMKAFTREGKEIVVCNCDGDFYAVERRCGHMNAPLEMGTLDGTILTCPTHCAQFDVTTGEALCGPMPHYLGKDPLPASVAKHTQDMGLLMQHIRTEPLRTYETKAESGWILVAVRREAVAMDD